MAERKAASNRSRKQPRIYSIRKILVPIDGSETSFKTTKYALRLAKASNASVTLLYVGLIPSFPRYISSLDKYNQQVRGHAQEWFNTIKNYPEAANIKIKTRVITSALSVVGTLVEIAKSEGTDLIVIGPRGRSKFSKLLLGSVTSGVTTYSPCPVLVVK